MRTRWLTLLLALGAIVPSAVAVRGALADEEEDEAQHDAVVSSDELSKARAALLRQLPTNETVLINVSQRDMPASPDILNLGRRATKALARCVSDNVEDDLRARCAEILGRVGDRSALVALQGALEAWGTNVRSAAIGALRKMPDASSVGPLTQILNREDEEPDNRAAALEALGAMSQGRAVRTLRDALRKPPQELERLRVPAFRGLWKSRHLVDRGNLVSDVSYALSTNNTSLTLAATFAASELRAPELVGPLVKLMKDPDTRVRNRAVYALGKIGDRTATRALLDQTPHVRESRMLNNIAFALERLDPQAFYRTAHDLVTHKQAQVRMNAAFVLGDVHRPEGLPLLTGALADDNDTVRLAAVTAIGKLDDKRGVNVLEKFVDNPDPTLQRAAIYAVFALSGYTRTDLVFDKLYAAPDVEQDQKLEAALALGRARDTRVTGDLLTCLELGRCNVRDVDGFLRTSRSPEVPGRTLLAWAKGRSDLTDLVATLKPQGAGLLSSSEVEAAIAHKEVARAVKAIDLAGDLSEAQATELLKSLLRHENARLRIHAAVALARADDPAAAASIFKDMDNLPQDQLPSLVRLLGRVSEARGRARLGPELEKRASGNDVPIAVAAAAVKLAWEPEQGIFRLLAALGGATRLERDLAEAYLVREEGLLVTELLRRALAREGRPPVRDQLRRILDLRAERAAARRPPWER